MRCPDPGLQKMLLTVGFYLSTITCFALLTAELLCYWPFASAAEAGAVAHSGWLVNRTAPLDRLPPLPTPGPAPREDIEQAVFDAIVGAAPVRSVRLVRLQEFDNLARSLTEVVPAATAAGPVGEVLSRYVGQALPNRDLAVLIDAGDIQVDTPQSNGVEIASRMINRADAGGHDWKRYPQMGIGVVVRGSRVQAVVILADPVITYDQPFPGRGGSVVSGHLEQPATSLSLQWMDLRRGWFTAVERADKRLEIPVDSDNRFRFTLPPVGGAWSQAVLVAGGRPLLGHEVGSSGGAP